MDDAAKAREQGATVLIVTHNLLEVERHADRYLLFNKGRLVRDEPTSALGLAEAKSTLSITAPRSSFKNFAAC